MEIHQKKKPSVVSSQNTEPFEVLGVTFNRFQYCFTRKLLILHLIPIMRFLNVPTQKCSFIVRAK